MGTTRRIRSRATLAVVQAGERARSLVVHPLPVIALVVLVLNDHWLKYAGVLPGWLTGKLSDFAGVVLAPLLISELLLLALKSERVLLPVFAAVGVGFAAIKLFGPARDLYLGVSDLLLGPLGVRSASALDSTDLVALAVLPPVYWWAKRRAASRAP